MLERRVKQLDWFCNSFYSTVESLPLSKIFCSDAKYLIESLASRNGCVLCADHENIGYELAKYKCCGGVCRRLSLSPGVSLECLHFMILTQGGSEGRLGQGKVNLYNTLNPG